jgi:glutathione S-transferase
MQIIVYFSICQVPVLYWDGEPIAQSMAIARFLAREFGLAGKPLFFPVATSFE